MKARNELHQQGALIIQQHSAPPLTRHIKEAFRFPLPPRPRRCKFMTVLDFGSVALAVLDLPFQPSSFTYAH